MIFKLKNHIVVLFSVIISILSISGIVISADESPEVSYSAVICDDYGVLTDEECQELTNYLLEKSLEANVNIAVVISDETDKSGAMDFADVYEEDLFGKNSNSILYLINMNDNYDWISCSGTAMDYYSQDTIDYILQNTSGEYLTSDYLDFYGCIQSYGDLVVSEQSQPMSTDTKIGISFLVGLVVSVIACCAIAISYKFHATTDASTYAKDGGIQFTQRKDVFIRTYTTKSAKPSDTHYSSGGGSHSGGGFQR